MQNSQNVQKFYEEVFQDFKNRLFTVYRFKSSISSQQIDKFTKLIKQKLSKKRQLFQTGIRLSLDRRSKKDQPFINKVKVQHQQQDDHYRQSQLKQPIKEQLQQEDRSSSQSEDDDLKEFKRQKEKNDTNVKVQPEQKEQPDADDNSQQQYEEQDKMKQDILARSSKKVCAHIIASYSTKNKKHIPKDEKTKIDLENVFIRTPERQVFYAKIQCDFQQAQYINIKL